MQDQVRVRRQANDVNELQTQQERDRENLTQREHLMTDSERREFKVHLKLSDIR